MMNDEEKKIQGFVGATPFGLDFFIVLLTNYENSINIPVGVTR